MKNRSLTIEKGNTIKQKKETNPVLRERASFVRSLPKITLAVFLLLISVHLFAAENEGEIHTEISPPSYFSIKPQMARTELKYNSARAKLVAQLFASHFDSIIQSSKKIDLVNSQNVIDALAQNGYTDDAALTRFAEMADIPVIVTGSVDDSGGRCVISLYALCYDAPHKGDRVGAYRALMRFGKSGTSTTLIVEEHTARFLSGLFRDFRHFVSADKIPDALLTDGSYPLYSAKSDSSPFGTISVKNGKLQSASAGYLLLDYRQEADFLDDYYHGRKKEMVLPPSSTEQALYTAVATPLVSLMAPLASPVSYYTVSDFGGLGLWGLNNTPWLCVATDGFFRSPDKLEDRGRHPTRYNQAANAFMWYYFLSAGSSLYADSISHYSMQQAASFDPLLPWAGNEATATALALLGSGGGFFYRGERAWGYVYFHTDAALLFASLYCLLPEKGRSDSENERYRVRGYAFASAALAVRIIEFIHSQSTPFSIDNGDELSGSYAIAPLANWDGALFAGLSASVNF